MSEGYRKAALRLHSMSAADRAWILQRLPEGERAKLSVLVRELHQLGIEPDQHLVDHLSGDEVRQTLLQAAAPGPGLADALDAMCAARPGEVAALLASEPDSMAAAVLSLYPWPWRARLLADYGLEQRQRIGRALAEAPQLKPRVRGELVKALAGRLAALRSDYPVFDEPDARDPGPGSEPAATRFMQGLRRWRP